MATTATAAGIDAYFILISLSNATALDAAGSRPEPTRGKFFKVRIKIRVQPACEN